jgi:hypothetical protein
VATLKGPCGCRKPATGLVEQAAADLNLDLTRTWLIGDTTSDVQCASSAGLFAVLVGTGHAGADARFSVDKALRFADASAAIAFIVGEFADLWPRCEAAAAAAEVGGRIEVRADDLQATQNVARLVAEAVRRRAVPVRLAIDVAPPPVDPTAVVVTALRDGAAGLCSIQVIPEPMSAS